MAAEHIAAVIQARTGSSRLPGKALAPFAGSTVLNHIVDRLRRVERPIEIMVATSDRSEDQAIVDTGVRAGVAVFRGSAEDVLGRFVGCVGAAARPPRLVLRICGDRPFLCPVLVGELLQAYDTLGHPDYLSNSLVPSYPRGLDLELVRVECLREAHSESQDPYEREHVTPFIYRRAERYRVAGLICPFGNYSHVDLALETRADYERLNGLHGQLPSEHDYRDVLNALELAP